MGVGALLVVVVDLDGDGVLADLGAGGGGEVDLELLGAFDVGVVDDRDGNGGARGARGDGD